MFVSLVVKHQLNLQLLSALWSFVVSARRLSVRPRRFRLIWAVKRWCSRKDNELKHGFCCLCVCVWVLSCFVSQLGSKVSFCSLSSLFRPHSWFSGESQRPVQLCQSKVKFMWCQWVQEVCVTLDQTKVNPQHKLYDLTWHLSCCETGVVFNRHQTDLKKHQTAVFKALFLQEAFLFILFTTSMFVFGLIF